MSEPDARAGREGHGDRLIAELREAVQAREELLDIAAHELRNPLTALLVQVEDALRLAPPHDTDLIGRLQRIERLIGRTAIRASALLEVSRLNAGRFRPLQEPVDLAEIVREAAASHHAAAEHALAPIRLAAPESLPLLSDRMALEQIVENLLSNAIKFGAGAPVEITLARASGAARLTVRDRGVGISPEDQARIFDRFERVVTAQPRGGFGLGLWIARRLVEVLGGTILMTSAAGEGSTFTVTLPLPPANLGAGDP
jgi:two-component system, OmpR family, sensor kinase